MRAYFAVLVSAVLNSAAFAQAPGGDLLSRFQQMSLNAEERGLSEPFVGVTTNGEVVPGLFAIGSTGVSTEPVREAAVDFLNALTPELREKTLFDVGDDEWRKWMNQHFYLRQGVGFNEMDETQRNAAFNLLRASLSAKGLKLTRDIMHLNQTLAGIVFGEAR